MVVFNSVLATSGKTVGVPLGDRAAGAVLEFLESKPIHVEFYTMSLNFLDSLFARSWNRIIRGLGLLWALAALVLVQPSSSWGQLELTEIDLFSGDIEITNIGDVATGGAMLEWCVPFLYGQLEIGTFSFEPGEVRTYNLGQPLDVAGEDLWIYLDRTGNFGDESKVTTGAVWGSDQSGQGRVNAVVDETGGAAWAVNTDFIPTTGITMGQTLQLIPPGNNPNSSSGWEIALANFGSFGMSLDCDYDDNGVCHEIGDANLLCGAIASMSTDLKFDVTGDGQVTNADFDQWLSLAGAANLASGNPYSRGDANLSGSTDVSDYGAWNSGRFTATASYSSGDFNCDGGVDVSDFGLWNSVKFTTAGLSVVPEPTAMTLTMLAILSSWAIARRRCRGAGVA